MNRTKRKLKRYQEKKRIEPVKCINCGKPGPHFVPPCLGEPGFFICEPDHPNQSVKV